MGADEYRTRIHEECRHKSEVNYGQRKLRLGFVGASETKYYEVSFNPDNSE